MPSTVLLTFLGTGNYQPCRYQLDDSTSQEEIVFFSVALAKHLNPDQVISLQTGGATARHGAALDAALTECHIIHNPITIPDGQSEAQLWQIFAALTSHIPEGCILHLDITHGFRSLPLLGFIALSYLRVTRRVTIGGIHYGAWEARDGNNLAPVFNLTPFLTLLDWTAAADQFLTTGSATRLGDMLSQSQQNLWQSPGSKAPSELPRRLKNLGSSLQEFSSNLILLRTKSLPKSATNLENQLAEANEEAGVHAPPFLEVLAPVQDQLLQFRNTDLPTLRDLVGWLAERGQTAPALTLASEWLTSYTMMKCGCAGNPADYQVRKPYSLAIAKLEQPKMDITPDKTGEAALTAIDILNNTLTKEQIANLVKAASITRSARNDLNHAGFNSSPATAAALIQRAQDVSQLLLQLP